MGVLLQGLNILIILIAIVVVIVRKLVTDPVAAVAGYRFLNKFDDQTKFNTEHHHYLTGPFRPIQDEVSNLETEVIFGSFPQDLEGLFLRVGPNPLPEKIAHGYHWFDGDGMIHSIRVKDRKALYSNKYIETPLYKYSKQYGGIVSSQLGELKGVIGLIKFLYVQFILQRVIPLPPLENGAANTAINYYNKKILLGYESNLPFEIQWKEDNSFVSKGYLHYNHTLDFPFTAHPKKDPEDGTLYFNGYSLDSDHKDATMKYGKIRGDHVETYFTIPLAIPTFAHDMSITENYVIIYDSSVIIDKMEILKEGQFYRFHDDKPFRIGLMSKSAQAENDIQWINVRTSFGIIHPLNAWEEPETNEIVIVAPLTKSFNGFDSRNHTNSINNYHMTELRVNVTNKKISSYRSVDAKAIVEFCNVHPSYLGRKAKYGFSGEIDPVTRNFYKIIKYQLYPKAEIMNRIDLPEDYVCGEPVIIPRHPMKRAASAEDYSDDVYLAIFATNLVTQKTEWMVFDGKTMDSKPVLHLRMIPERYIPLGFHGLWIDEKDLQEHIASGNSL